MLPTLPYNHRVPKSTQLQFGGYDHRRAAGNGTIWDEKNMSSVEAPLIEPRNLRYLCRTLTKPNGIYAGDEMYLFDGTNFYVDGVQKWSELTDTKKVVAQLGNYTCVWPDKMMYKRYEGGATMYPLQHSVTLTSIFTDGTLYGEPAEANSLQSVQIDPETQTVMGWSLFEVGDAVKITCANMPQNEKTIIIREIGGDGTILRFYENSFETSDQAYSVTVTREVPDLDYVCVNENRVWGCKGDTIYCSKLGDPTNWNVFDGLSTDSWAVTVGSEGDFTGCVSYLGYPCFFKEDHVYKVYGDKPSNYHVMQSADLGVMSGSGASFGIAGEVLYYLSRAGVVAYTGGIPSGIAEPFGEERYKNAVGGSDGLRYYISMTDGANAHHLFVYDTRYGVWHREDDLDAMGIVWYKGGLYALCTNGRLWWLEGDAPPQGSVVEDGIESFVEFGDFDEGSPQRKGHSHVEVRGEVEDNSSFQLWIQYDSSGTWTSIGQVTPGKKRSVYFPVIPRRCDHWRLKITGEGKYRIYSITRTFYTGSEFH